jgi:hypothetical protein
MFILNKSMKKIIIGIASVPERIDCLKDTIESLIPQCDKIILGLNNYKEIPNFTINEKIEVNLLDNSLGDAAKFYKIEDNKDVYYLTCDDDLIYPKDYVNYLIDKTKKYNVPVGLHGAIIKKPVKSMYKDRHVLHFNNTVEVDTIVDYVGTGTMCYDTSKLNIKLSDFKVPNMADIWFGDIMNKNQIKPIVVAHEEGYLTYNPKMLKQNITTIYDEFIKNKNDNIQTSIVNNW